MISRITKQPVRFLISIISYLLVPTARKPQSPVNKNHFRATIILGIISNLFPQFFNAKDQKNIAESLEIILLEDQKGTYRVPALEIIGLNFSMLESHLNGANIIKTILAMAGFSVGIQPVQITHSASTPSSGLSPAHASLMTSTFPPAVMGMAKVALLQITMADTPLVIHTITSGLTLSKSAQERGAFLKYVGLILKQVSTFSFTSISDQVATGCSLPSFVAYRGRDDEVA